MSDLSRPTPATWPSWGLNLGQSHYFLNCPLVKKQNKKNVGRTLGYLMKTKRGKVWF